MIKNDLSLYLVNQAGQQYKLPIYEDVRYSQTFSEEELEQKTLHNPEFLYKGGFTRSYNEGNFNFTIPLMDSTTMRVLFSIFFQHNPQSFELFYIENGKIINLNICVVTGITFNFVKDAITTASIEGQYSHAVDNAPLFGTPQPSFGELYTYIEGIGITLNSTPIPHLTGFSLELSNEIEWLEHTVMHNNGPTYPTEFYCASKTISGNFTKNEDLNLPSFADSVPLLVQIKSNGAIFLEFDFPSVISTSRPELAPIIKKGFDFRVNSNGNNRVRYKGVSI